jgi:hypothetical protein
MEFSQKLSEMFWTLFEQLPSLLTIAGCTIVAAVRWKRHPKVSLLVLVALLLIIIHAFVFAAVYAWVPDLILKGNYQNLEASRNVYLALGVLYHASLAVPFAILLVGIFGNRNEDVNEPRRPAVALAA